MSLRKKWLRDNNKMIGNDIIFTKSTHFIMPMVGYELADFLSTDERTNYLINCHLDLTRNRIVIIVTNTEDRNIRDLLIDNESNPYFLESIYDDENREIVLFYTIPDKFKEDFNIFLTSKYSKMSNMYKSKLVEIYGRETNTKSFKANQFDVLYPTSYKKQQWAEHFGVDVSLIEELSSLLNMEYETYKNINELLNITITNKKQEEQI